MQDHRAAAPLIVQNAFTVEASMDDVFDALRDVRTVLPCIDARVTEVVDGHTARGEITVPMGEDTMVFAGTLCVGEADRQAGAITFEAVGHGAQDASARGRMSVRLRESGGTTTVSVQADVAVEHAPLAVDGEQTRRAASRLLARLDGEVSAHIARREEPPVRGTVRLMAPPVPSPASSVDAHGGVAGVVERHPWVVPAALLGATALLLAMRRRPPR